MARRRKFWPSGRHEFAPEVKRKRDRPPRVPSRLMLRAFTEPAFSSSSVLPQFPTAFLQASGAAATAAMGAAAVAIAVLGATTGEAVASATVVQTSTADLAATTDEATAAFSATPIRQAVLAAVAAPAASTFQAESVIPATGTLLAVTAPATATMQGGPAHTPNLAAVTDDALGALGALQPYHATVEATTAPAIPQMSAYTIARGTLSATGGNATGSMQVFASTGQQDNRAARAALSGMVRSVYFDSASDVYDHMWRNGTYLSHLTTPPGGETDWAQWVSSSHQLADIRRPGYTGCLLIRVMPEGGEPDTRNPTPWQTGVSYAVDQAVTRVATNGNLNIFTALVAHVSDSSNGPALSNSDNAFWNSWGTTGTASDDSHVDCVYKLDSAWEDIAGSGSQHKTSAFQPGDDVWIMVDVKVPRYFTESRWAHNAGSGGNKLFILRDWFRAFGDGQIFASLRGYWDHLTFGIVYPGGSFRTLELLEDVFPDTDYAEQPFIRITSAADHPTGENPNTGTSWEQRLKGYGGVRSWCDPSMSQAQINNPGLANPGNPRGSDQRSGGWMVRRDMADRWTAVMVHIKYGTPGQPNSIVEFFVAPEGENFSYAKNRCLFSRNDVVMSGTDYSSYTPGTVNTAYGNPGPITVTDMLHNGIWLLAQNTARIKHSNNHPDGDLPTWVAYQEISVRRGPESIPAPGFITGLTSRFSPANSPATLSTTTAAATASMVAQSSSTASLVATTAGATSAFTAAVGAAASFVSVTAPSSSVLTVDAGGSGPAILAGLSSTPLEVVVLPAPSAGYANLNAAIPGAGHPRGNWAASSGTTEQGTAAARGNDIFNAYCGGFWDFENRILHWNGGGHAMSWNNGTFDLDASGTEAFWQLRDISQLGIASSATPFYSDGKWASVHSYCSFAKTDDGWLLRAGGALQPTGSDLGRLLGYNLSPSNPVYQDYGRGSMPGASSFYCDVVVYWNGYVWYYRPPFGVYAVMRWSDKVWVRPSGSLVAVGGSGGATMSHAYDSLRHRSICVGAISSSGGRTQHYLQYAIPGGGGTPTATRVELAWAGDDPYMFRTNKPAVEYDPQHDCFWAARVHDGSLPNAGDAPAERLAQISRARWVNDTTLEVENFDLDWSQVPFNRNVRGGVQWNSLPNGGWGKLLPVKDNNCLLILNRIDQPVLAVRMPA